MQQHLDWHNHPEITVSRSLPADRLHRQFLVFVAASSEVATNPSALLAPIRNFDVAVRYFCRPDKGDPVYTESEYVLTGGLSKFDSAKKFLEQMRLIDKYEGFLFMDGDIEFAESGIDRFFGIVNRMQFGLAQAALTSVSFSSWPVTFSSSIFYCRETNFVEIMAPYFSRRALKKVIHTFDECISGYGLDFAWYSILKKEKIGIIDVINMHHLKLIDREGGSFYLYLKSIGINPKIEQIKMLDKYGISSDERPHDVCGYFLKDPLVRRHLARVPLFHLPKFVAPFMRLQDSLAVAAGQITGSIEEISFEQPLP